MPEMQYEVSGKDCYKMMKRVSQKSSCYTVATFRRKGFKMKMPQAASNLAWDVCNMTNGSAYGIRTRDLRLERAMS